MKAPIDLACPKCEASAGTQCHPILITGKGHPTETIEFHHAERVDAAFRVTTPRSLDPRALREALREAITRMTKQNLAEDDLSFVITTREVFGL